MGNRSRYRKLPDLFVVGKEVVFQDPDDGPVVIWMQALNPFEMQECRNAAQSARGRVVMAIKTYGSPEYDIVRARFLQLEPKAAMEELADGKYAEWYLNAQQGIDVDPEWAERLVVLRTSGDSPLSSLPEEEATLIATLNQEYIEEVNKRVQDDKDYFIVGLEKLTNDELEKEFLDAWTERRAQSQAMSEYNLTEIYWGARICEAVPDEVGSFVKGSHAKCNHHRERVFETPEEVRSLPEEMQSTLRRTAEDLAMSVRDAKNSARQGSSSDSSPLPSTEEESTPSTPTETSATPPGT